MSDVRCLMSDAGCRILIDDFRFQITGYQPWTIDYQPLTLDPLTRLTFLTIFFLFKLSPLSRTINYKPQTINFSYFCRHYGNRQQQVPGNYFALQRVWVYFSFIGDI